MSILIQFNKEDPVVLINDAVVHSFMAIWLWEWHTTLQQNVQMTME
jgi:hypothetical protein